MDPLASAAFETFVVIGFADLVAGVFAATAAGVAAFAVSCVLWECRSHAGLSAVRHGWRRH